MLPGALLSGAMLLTVAGLYWLPTLLSDALGWHAPAVEYVVTRAELAGLWLLVAWAIWRRRRAWPAVPVAVWASAEAGMGAVCRLALPMGEQLRAAGVPVCVAAYGASAEWASVALAGVAVWVVAAASAPRGAHHGGQAL